MGYSSYSHPTANSLNWVWSVAMLEWVMMTQPGGGGGGDATAANQVIGNASLASIDGKLPALVGGRVPVDGSGVTQPVSGTFWQATQPVSGPLTDAQLRASAVPVSATDLDIRNLAPATDVVAVGDGSATATIRNLAANDALNVAIVDGNGDQITSFGGGTQYADGAARGSATGTLAMGDDGVNIQSVHVDTSGDLQVDVITMPTVAVTQSGAWTVTANAGTNLNTSALSLEATQADVRTALQIIDDWDESDRAKVNPIVGQAGVQGGAGAVSASTQRVAIATDANVVSSKTALTPASPVAVSVGVASTQILAANASRKGVRIVNTSSARISLGHGAAAVLDSGMTLYPGGVFNMDEFDFHTGAINGIASAAASNAGAQEFT